MVPLGGSVLRVRMTARVGVVPASPGPALGQSVVPCPSGETGTQGPCPGTGRGAPRGDPARRAAMDGPLSAGPFARCAGEGKWVPGSCRRDGCVVGGGPCGRRCQLAALPGPAGARLAVEKQLGTAWRPASACHRHQQCGKVFIQQFPRELGTCRERSWSAGHGGWVAVAQVPSALCQEPARRAAPQAAQGTQSRLGP